jgi:hypothetical protein
MKAHAQKEDASIELKSSPCGYCCFAKKKEKETFDSLPL